MWVRTYFTYFLLRFPLEAFLTAFIMLSSEINSSHKLFQDFICLITYTTFVIQLLAAPSYRFNFHLSVRNIIGIIIIKHDLIRMGSAIVPPSIRGRVVQIDIESSNMRPVVRIPAVNSTIANYIPNLKLSLTPQ